MANKFNHHGTEGTLDPTDGSLDIWGATLRASNLGVNQNVITDSRGRLVTQPLGAGVAGNDTEIQFNDSGFHGGDPLFLWDTTAKLFTVNGITIDIAGDISRGAFFWIHEPNAGNGNFGLGESALQNLTTAVNVTGTGFHAGIGVTIGSDNTFTGTNAAAGLIDGLQNCFYGVDSGLVAGDANGNTCYGYQTFMAGSGDDNCVYGHQGGIAMNAGADQNNIFGAQAARNFTTASLNNVFGFSAGFNLLTGTRCLLFGHRSGINYTSSESNNICLSHEGVVGDDDTIRIGTSGTHDRAFIQGIHDVIPAVASPDMMIIDSAGQIGSTQLPLSNGVIFGLGITSATAATITIAIGECRDRDNEFNIINTGVLTTDLGVSGVGGLDTGSETANTWYFIHVIADSTGASAVSSLFSLSETAPLLPGTYDFHRMVGAVRNNGSSNLLTYIGTTDGATRTFWWDEEETTLEILTNGSATTWASVSLVFFVPPNATATYLNCNNTGSSDAGQHFSEFRDASQSVTAGVLRVYAGAGVGSEQFILPTPVTAKTVQYQNSDASVELDIHVSGYIMQV